MDDTLPSFTIMMHETPSATMRTNGEQFSLTNLARADLLWPEPAPPPPAHAAEAIAEILRAAGRIQLES